MSALIMVAWKCFNGKFTATNTDTNADPDNGSLKSPHTLFDKYLNGVLVKFEQNHLVQNFELFEKKKWFGRRFDASNCLMLNH